MLDIIKNLDQSQILTVALVLGLLKELRLWFVEILKYKLEIKKLTLKSKKREERG